MPVASASPSTSQRPGQRRAPEREVKLDVADDFVLPDLTGVVDAAVVASCRDLQLDAEYHDTDDLRLLRRGITLRYRRGEDAGGTWTLKLPMSGDRYTFDRDEWWWPGTAEQVPDEARTQLRGLTRHRELGVVADIRTRRRRIELRGAGAGVLAEVDDDVVVAVADRASVRFREVEIELRGGDERVAEAIAGRLIDASGGRATPGRVPKLERVLAARLASLRGPAAGAAGPRSTLAQVVTAAVAHGLDRLLENDVQVRSGEDVEAVHQARVATRRLRSDLKTFDRVLDPEWQRAVRDELRWLGELLGAVRDADVLGARLLRQAAQIDEKERPAVAGIQRRLAGQRQAARTELLVAVDSPRYFDLVDGLERAVAVMPWRTPGHAPGPGDPSWRPTTAGAVPLAHLSALGSNGNGATGPQTAGRRKGREISPADPAAPALATLVRRPWRRLWREVGGLGPTPTDAELHQVRILAKQVRYAAEAVTPVLGQDARRVASATKGLQEVLGDHHDAVAAADWLRQVVAVATPAEVFAAGQLVTIERLDAAALRARWPAAWRQVDRRGLRRWTNARRASRLAARRA